MNRGNYNGKEEKKEGADFFCDVCKLEFEVRWIDIFDLQDMTHGYVSFNLWDEYIACPKCGENANKSNNGFIERSKLNTDFDPDTDLPF